MKLARYIPASIACLCLFAGGGFRAGSSDCNVNGIPDAEETATAFIAHTVHNWGSDTHEVIIVDLDGDGWPDIAGASNDAVFWFRNENGAGSFGPPRLSGQPNTYYYFRLDHADLDGDGDQDLISTQGGNLVWFQNIPGGGLLDLTIEIPDSSSLNPGFDVADFDGDNDLDMLISTRSYLRWLENTNGAGTFEATAEFYSTRAQWANPLAADMDNDGDPDAIHDINWSVVGMHENKYRGTFGDLRLIDDTAGSNQEFVAADVDGDDDLDLLVGTTTETVWYPNLEGEGNFAAQRSVGGGSHKVLAVDLDHDGDLDVVAVTSSSSNATVVWYENLDGAGAFSETRTISPIVEGSSGVAVADLDGDGDLDVVEGNDSRVVWYENTSNDCNGNAIPDACEPDCDNNGIADDCDPDCNANGRADVCDLVDFSSDDCNGNSVPDECEPDCNGNSIADACDVAVGTSNDCSRDGIPDECEPDCNANFVPDSCDILSGVSEDCTGDGVPDECHADCDANGDPDICEVLDGTGADCNDSDLPDVCDVDSGLSTDCDHNGEPDECDTTARFSMFTIDGSLSAEAGSAVDVDGDGDQDLVVVQGGVHWYENTDGRGSFGPQRIVTDVSAADFLATPDVNGDGLPDAIWNRASSPWGLWWSANLGTGQFADPAPIGQVGGFLPLRVLPFDVDGDRDLDVLTHDTALVWNENIDGAGTFAPRQVLWETALEEPRLTPVATLDVDEDGRRDLIVESDGRFVSWLRNLGAGNFARPIELFSSRIDRLEVADMDNDGDLDLILASDTTQRIHLFENLDGTPRFDQGLLVNGFVSQPILVPPVDFDRDGDLDVIEIDRWLTWNENLSEAGGGWYPHRLLQVGCCINRFIAVADFNGDGNLDAATNDLSSGIVWHRNEANDCNGNGLPDVCDLVGDCNGNGVLDECEADCNGDGTPDACEIAARVAADCDGNLVPDECQPDCNGNGTADTCDVSFGTSADTNSNHIPDECEPDCNGNGLPDNLEPDCDGNGIPDSCDIANAAVADCNDNGVPDSCDVGVTFAPHPWEALDDLYIADLDGDLDADIVASSSAAGIHWLENVDGRGTFEVAHPIQPDEVANRVLADDLDGDGDMDVVIASSTVDGLAWFENLGGSFGPRRLIAANVGGVGDLAVADLDSDGDLDVVAGSYDRDAVSLHENLDGQGTFAFFVDIANAEVRSVDVADLDHDGDLDVLFADRGDEAAWIANDGTGSFSDRQEISQHDYLAVAADLDGDGDQDVVSSGFATAFGTLGWSRNVNATGSFEPLQELARELVRVIGLEDIDGDGDVDIAYQAYSDLYWLENVDGVGGFGQPQAVAVDLGGDRETHTADADGDGDVDILTNVGWFENLSDDCNGNGTPDVCEPDCNENGIVDTCELRDRRLADCNGNQVPDACEAAFDEQDTDSDGCIDTVDTNFEDPFRCGDSDLDSCDDCTGGAWSPRSDGVNSDSDGICDAGDCMPLDNTVWRSPTAARALELTPFGDVTLFEWLPPGDPGSTYLRYDTLHSGDSADFEAGICLVSDATESFALLQDTQPSPGEPQYYVIRVDDPCADGDGNLGTTSDGNRRAGPVCP